MTIITETWFRSCPELTADLLDIENGTGISFICKNRQAGPNGVAYGGVAIAFRKTDCMLKEVKVRNPNDFEIVAALGSVRGQSRKLAVIAIYIPPNYVVGRGNLAVECVADAIMDINGTTTTRSL